MRGILPLADYTRFVEDISQALHLLAFRIILCALFFIVCRSHTEHFLVNRFYVPFECTISDLLPLHTRNISSSQLDETNITFSSAKKVFR